MVTKVVLIFSYQVRSNIKVSSSLSILNLDGPGREKKLMNPVVRVVEGKLRSTVTVVQKWMKHIVILNKSPGVDGTGLMVSHQAQKVLKIWVIFSRLRTM